MEMDGCKVNDRLTLSRIAEQAGVSIGTVSKALRGTGQLSIETRSRIQRLARELGYQGPLVEPRSPGRSYLVGLVTTDSFGRFTIPIMTGAEDTFAQGQMSILLAETRGDPIRERYYLETLKDRQVDGLIVTGRSSDPRPSLSSEIDIPTVYALAPSLDPKDISIVPNDIGGAERAVNHMLSTGRSSIAVVVGPEQQAASSSRVEGAKRALEKAGIPMFGGGPLYGEWSERWGYEAANRLLALGEFDGVLCASDQIARGLLESLRDQNIAVPSSVAVVGMDNWAVMTEAARPSISSVDLNLSGVGREAAKLLVRMISGESVRPGTRLIETRLVPREST